jgi:starvation-inducible outer membrane lipoprotein
MKRLPLFMAMSATLSLFLSACATTEPEGLESTLHEQNQRMKKSAEKSRARAEARERKWKEYSSRADARYEQWFDSVMD